MNICSCIVNSNLKISENVYLIKFNAPEIADKALSGQFVHVRISESIDPLLRRPFSIFSINKKSGEVGILYRVVGRGTNLLSKITKGQVLNVLGPLGNSFPVEADYSTAVIVAGGMGVAPMFLLADQILKAGKNIRFLWGARTKHEIWKDLLTYYPQIKFEIATNDGSAGFKGVVTDLVSNLIINLQPDQKIRGFVCGPQPLLEKLQSLIKGTGMEFFVSMEEKMACGIGVCQGCAVKTESQYKMVCSDGPVFNLEGIEFNG